MPGARIPFNPAQTPFDNPSKYNQEVASRKKAEETAALSKVKEQAEAAFQEMGETLRTRKPPNIPQGFASPPPPVVGETTGGTYPKGRIPIMTPPMTPVEMTPEQEEAYRQKIFAEAGIEPPEGFINAQQEQPIQEDHKANVQQNPPPRRQYKKATIVQKEIHPILRQLRLDIGIETLKTIDLTIADHVWTFTPLTPEMISLSLRLAERSAAAEDEKDTIKQQIAVCCSIVAIDHVPLWQVFGLEPEVGDDLSRPLSPKGTIRQRAAISLLQELMINSKLGVFPALIEAYTQEVDPFGEVKGYTQYKDEKFFRYTCPIEGCQRKLVRPKKFDANNNPIPVYCENHGEEMVTETDEPINSPMEVQNPLGLRSPKMNQT